MNKREQLNKLTKKVEFKLGGVDFDDLEISEPIDSLLKELYEAFKHIGFSVEFRVEDTSCKDNPNIAPLTTLLRVSSTKNPGRSVRVSPPWGPWTPRYGVDFYGPGDDHYYYRTKSLDEILYIVIKFIETGELSSGIL